jgi:hypothetical protein
MKPRALVLVGTLLLLLAAARAFAQEAGRRYVESHGDRRGVVVFSVVRTADGFVVSSVASASSEEGRWVAGTGLVSWRQWDPGTGTGLLGVRTGNTIRLSGALQGKPVDREVRVDPAPWYQIFGPAMLDLLPPDAAHREFWVVNPADLSAHKMQVRRAGTETVRVNGESVPATRIHFSPAGALAPFWGADFWYRLSDGAWVYSRLPEDGGLTVTTIAEKGT